MFEIEVIVKLLCILSSSLIPLLKHSDRLLTPAPHRKIHEGQACFLRFRPDWLDYLQVLTLILPD